MSMKEITVGFVDFNHNFNLQDNAIVQLLRQNHKVILSDDPDYVFYSVFGTKHYLARPDSVRIFITGENIAPDFQFCDYAITFEHLSYGDRHVRVPLPFWPGAYSNLIAEAAVKHLDPEKTLAEKTGFCSFVYSNFYSDGQRNNLFYALEAYKPVASGGSVLNNQGGRVPDKLAFERKYKFSIAGENTSHPGYSTEKPLGAFAAKAVPIYYGDPEICRDYNADAFIRAADFASLDELVAYVRKVDEDDALYLRYLSQPAFVRPSLPDEYCQSYIDFLNHIVDQDFEAAHRRNRIMAGGGYDLTMEHLAKLDRTYDKTVGRAQRLWRRLPFGK